MIQRVAQQVPLPCYGIEQKESNPLCPSCQHRDECKSVMGKRFGRVTIDRSNFNFMPTPLEDIAWSDEDDFKQTYEECYRIIFRDPSNSSRMLFEPDSLHKRPGLSVHVVNEAKRLNCPIKLFILTVMWGHRNANPTARFYCTMLGGDAAAKRVQRYRAEVEDQYGAFTEKTLDEYANEDVAGQLHAEQLLTAEVLAGNWIVGYKTRRGGAASRYFYETNELLMPDVWLAIEPTYHDRLIAWRSDAAPVPCELRRKRIRVIKLISTLKRRSRAAIALFKARESIMSKAIQRVVQDKGFTVKHFNVDPQQDFLDSFDFWSKLGLAIQHYWCLELLHGDQHLALKHLSSGTFSNRALDSNPTT